MISHFSLWWKYQGSFLFSSSHYISLCKRFGDDDTVFKVELVILSVCVCYNNKSLSLYKKSVLNYTPICGSSFLLVLLKRAKTTTPHSFFPSLGGLSLGGLFGWSLGRVFFFFSLLFTMKLLRVNWILSNPSYKSRLVNSNWARGTICNWIHDRVQDHHPLAVSHWSLHKNG